MKLKSPEISSISWSRKKRVIKTMSMQWKIFLSVLRRMSALFFWVSMELASPLLSNASPWKKRFRLGRWRLPIISLKTITPSQSLWGEWSVTVLKPILWSTSSQSEKILNSMQSCKDLSHLRFRNLLRFKQTSSVLRPSLIQELATWVEATRESL